VISVADDDCAATGGESGNATITISAKTAIVESRRIMFPASARAVETCTARFDFMVISWLSVRCFVHATLLAASSLLTTLGKLTNRLLTDR